MQGRPPKKLDSAGGRDKNDAVKTRSQGYVPGSGADGRVTNHVNLPPPDPGPEPRLHSGEPRDTSTVASLKVTTDEAPPPPRPTPGPPPDPGPRPRLHCSMSPIAITTAAIMTEEQIRAFLKAHERKRGDRIVVKWRLSGADGDWTCWCGSLQRIGGRGVTVSYDSEIGAEKWGYTVESILPNPEIEVASLTDSTTELRASAPPFAVPALPRVQAAPTPAAPPHDGPPLHTPPAVFNPIEWDDIFTAPDATANIRIDEDAETAGDFDADGDSQDDDGDSNEDDVESEIRYWTPPLPSTHERVDPAHTRGRQSEHGHSGCSNTWPRRGEHPPGSSVVPTPMSRRTRAHNNARASQGPTWTGCDAAGSAFCASRQSVPGTHQQAKEEKKLEVDNNYDVHGATARSIGPPPHLRAVAERVERSSAPKALSNLEIGHESGAAPGQRGGREAGQALHRREDSRAPGQPSNSKKHTMRTAGGVANGSEMRRCAEAQSNGYPAVAKQDVGYLDQGQDCRQARSVYSTHGNAPRVSVPTRRAAGSSEHSIIPNDHRGDDAGSTANSRRCIRTTEYPQGSTADPSEQRDATGDNNPVLRPLDNENAAEISGVRASGESASKCHAASGNDGIRRVNVKQTPNNGPKSIEKMLREVGKGAASWNDLGGKQQGRQGAAGLPVHTKDVVGAVCWGILERCSMAHETEMNLVDAKLWTTNSIRYGKIRQVLNEWKTSPSTAASQRITNGTTGLKRIPTKDAEAWQKVGKLQPCRMEDVSAWCNYYSRPEWEKIPPRRRGLLEPMINDIIRAVETVASAELPYSVKYTSKKEIRENVASSEWGATADMSAWFDQLGIHGIEDLFGVLDEDGNPYLLMVTGMGFMPICRVAQATLSALCPHPARCPVAKFVDNVAFFGSYEATSTDMLTFKKRAADCGAIINDENNSPRKKYEFLGESYDHELKTRCLTQKTTEKVERCWQLTKQSGKMTCRRALAIIGTLQYAAEILNVDIAQYPQMIATHTSISCEAAKLNSWDHKVHVSDKAMLEIHRVAAICKKNEPVAVMAGYLREHGDIETTLWVDASMWGWGAVIMSKGYPVKFISQQWSEADHEEAMQQGGTLSSSVTAEPMAIRRALCSTTIAPGSTIELFSDHSGFVSAAVPRNGKRRNYGFCTSYDAALTLLADLEHAGVSVRVSFVAGAANPADALSRGKPPILHVTSVGVGNSNG